MGKRKKRKVNYVAWDEIKQNAEAKAKEDAKKVEEEAQKAKDELEKTADAVEKKADEVKAEINETKEEVKEEVKEATAGETVAEKSEDKKDEKPEDKKDEKPEDKKDEKPEDKKDEKSEDNKDEKSEDKKDEKSEDNKVEKPEDNKDEKSEDKKDESPAAYVNPEVAEYKKKKKKKLIVALSSVAAILLICTLVYFVGVFKERGKFHKNTTINGIDVSGMDIEEAKEALLASANDYSVTVIFKGSEEIINIGDGDLCAVLDTDIEELLDKQNPYLWFLNINEKYAYEANFHYEYDKQKMIAYLEGMDELDPEGMIPSKNASVRMVDGKVEIKEDVTGTELHNDKLYDELFKTLDNKENKLDVEASDCYVKANITADSEIIVNSAKVAEDYLNLDASYLYQDEVIKISKEDLNKMAYIGNDGSIVVIEDQVKAYVDRMADTFVQIDGVSKSQFFTTYDGREIEISTSKRSWIFDKSTEVSELMELLSLGEDFQKEPAYMTKDTRTGANTPINGDYIEISLGGQHVYVFIGGQMVFDTPCVSGCVSEGHSTPSGIYRIQYLERNTYLVGPTWKSYVEYWMPFNGSIGLHDASWRGSFGGNIYYYNGSHGCVNLPCDAAATIYNMIYPGMPVIAYWD